MFYKICEGIEPIYKVGERFMQIALSNGEDIEWVQVNSLEELGTTDRDGGFSSTGRL
jgi:dUTPase